MKEMVAACTKENSFNKKTSQYSLYQL